MTRPIVKVTKSMPNKVAIRHNSLPPTLTCAHIAHQLVVICASSLDITTETTSAPRLLISANESDHYSHGLYPTL